jgi:HK97 family phage portal protein
MSILDRLWPFGKQEKRGFSPGLSVMLANAGVGQLSGSGVAVNQDSALRFMAVYACVRVIAEDIASLPLPVYRRLTRGKERAPTHPLYPVLHDQANPEQTSFAFRETMMSHVLLWGNAYAEKEMVNGRVAALWPLSPYRVSVQRNTRTNQLEYIVSPPGTDERRVLGTRQIFHLPGLSLNGVTGLSPIGYAREAIGLGLAAQEFASGFFARGARPSLVLEHPGTLSEAAHQRMRADFEAMHTGLSNAQRVAILEEGTKASTTFINPEDAQFVEQRQFSVAEICRLYRMQPHKIADLSRATFTNIEQQNIEHVIDTVRPWAVRWEQAISKDLIPVEERDRFLAEFLLVGLLRGDSAARAAFYEIMVQIGAMSPNDVREAENLNPRAGGDVYVTPQAGSSTGSSNGRQPVPIGAGG